MLIGLQQTPGAFSKAVGQQRAGRAHAVVAGHGVEAGWRAAVDIRGLQLTASGRCHHAHRIASRWREHDAERGRLGIARFSR